MMILPNSASSAAASNNPSSMMNNFAGNLPHPQNPPINTTNPWIITAQEHQANEGQFAVLRPMNGMIGGEQARPFFLKSGLPATILAQIWQLSDLNKDGKLDRLEFSIAMKLVRNSLAGLPLPPTLPDSMRQISGYGGGGPPRQLPTSLSGQFNGGIPSAYSTPMSQPQMPPRPMSTYGTMPAMSSAYRPPPYGGSYSAAQTPTHAPGALPFQMGTKELGDWTLPQPLKLRFCQQFNQLDRSRVGLLTGQQARGVLGESQLPSQLLAQIWTMSDVNKDGCLSIEEFCTAQFLIEMIKSGYALPPKLPNELNAFCHRSRTVSPSTVTSTPTDPNAPPPQKGGTGQFKTFEDKRKDNLDKGQAELDRRRQILREEEERRRTEIERREREEAERKERERQELERRREAEMEMERQRQLENDRIRAAEEERFKAQRDEARRKLEQERIKELEKIRTRDFENQLQAETEKTTQIQQRQRQMAFQLQALDERSQQLNTDIGGSRDKILEITQEIEGMRAQRDEKCARIQALERRSKELTIQSERFSHENLQLQSECQRQLSRTQQIETLRKELTEIDSDIQRMEEEEKTVNGRAENQEKLVVEKRPDWEKSCEQMKSLEKEHQELLEKYNTTRQQVHPQTAVQAPPVLYEMPPDAVFGSTAERRTSKESQQSVINAFGNDFTPNFANAFGGKQKSIDEGVRGRAEDEGRRKSESASIGSVAKIAAKLQEQQRQASLSREGSVASTTGGRPTIIGHQMPASSSSMEAIQAQQTNAQSTGALKTVKYRALYEFTSRSGDELSLQPGDVVLVFEGHQSEPGWLAGQIRDKVGWFPAAFAEPIATSTSSPGPAATATAFKKSGSLTGSPSGEPLAIIQEEGEVPPSAAAAPIIAAESQQKPFVADFASAFSKSVSLMDTTAVTAASTNTNGTTGMTAGLTASRSAGAFAGGALYDLPPSNDNKAPVAKFEEAKPTATAAAPLYEMPPGDGAILASGMTTTTPVVDKALLGTGVALYQWKARNEQEMSFARGEIIEVLEQGEMRWRGRLQKNRIIEGWFPKSYIKLGVTSLDSNGTATKAQAQQEKVGSIPAGGQATVKVADNRREQSQLIKPVGEGKGAGTGPGDWFIALYQFDAVEPTDLSLKPGDRIWVTDQHDQWWRGTCEGRSGIFPANYVQKTSEASEIITPNDLNAAEKQTIGRAIAAFEATASNQIALQPGDIVKVHQMTQGGWWEGELERDGQHTDRRFGHVGWFPGNYIQILQSADGQSQQGGRLVAVAAFDYVALHADELSFKCGDMIEVVDRSDVQWWRGRKYDEAQQKEGEAQPALLFPATFVQLR